MPGTPVKAALLCAALCSAAFAEDVAAVCDAGWARMMQTRWFEPTGLVYGREPARVRSSAGAVGGLFRWKEGAGYGAGMSDCALVCGTALAGLADRESALRDGSTRDVAAKVARGVLNLAKLHGFRGFVARGICPDDCRTICALSSRDQLTHWLHGLWRYSRSPAADPALVAEWRSLVADVARRIEETATEERGWNFGQADGAPDPRGICTMWGPDVLPHEAARLPMVYAAAFMATGDGHWRDLYERCIDEALDRTLEIEGPGRAGFLKKMPNYALCQAAASLELIRALETNPARLEKIDAAMRAFAAIAAARAKAALGKPDAKQYGMCWDGELALAMLMAPEDARPEWLPRFVEESVRREPLDTASTCRAAHMLAACWRMRLAAGLRAAP